ncbi:MAG: RES domain-containing protein [Lachnoanaerobaculum sp.]|uniref:RES family NAD+ phosphorylase n=1 Tax=Lachnoanaerobaculum sp. TaxID=2049030 RepID=UPI0025C3A549|nr:RES family NAD+ phosphorylase [Lachnoanaerobaculum sp.]MBS5882466.1 RES domain-containing protein [Lachnoanaerobaculum sp.]
MICTRCDEFKIILAVEEYIVRSTPKKGDFLEELFDKLSINQEVESICRNCGNKISKSEFYFDDDDELMKRLYHFIGEQLTSKIKGCECCSQPAEVLSSIRRYFDEEDDVGDMIDDLDTSIEVGEFIYDQFGLDSIDEIVKSMYCPVCSFGSGPNYDEKIDYGFFDECSGIYTKESLDEFDERFYGKIEEIEKEVSLLANELTMEELVDLKDEYIQNKLYVSQNKAFSRLEEVIKSLYEKGGYYRLASRRTIFRTRTMDFGYQISELPSDDKLWEPPYGVSGHGRYNDIGVSVLYCANNLDVLREEVPLDHGKEYVYAKFILSKTLKMFPINFVFKRGKDKQSDFDGLISQPSNSDSKSFRIEYIMSNIVAAICSRIGYNGIAYKSTKCPKSINYAFLRFEKNIDLNMVEVFK